MQASDADYFAYCFPYTERQLRVRVQIYVILFSSLSYKYFIIIYYYYELACYMGLFVILPIRLLFVFIVRIAMHSCWFLNLLIIIGTPSY